MMYLNEIKKDFERIELDARFDARKSFYGKAEVERKNNELILYSYDTEVCRITQGLREDLELIIYSDYAFCSGTTTRHIKEFLRQCGYTYVENKKQLLEVGITEQELREIAELHERTK